MARSVRWWVGAAAALLAVVAAGPAGAQALTLRHEQAQGDISVHQYSISLKLKADLQKGLTVEEAQIALQMKTRTEVQEVLPNGDRRVQSQVLSGGVSLKAPGEEKSGPLDNAVANYTVGPQGTLKAAELLTGQPAVLPELFTSFGPDEAFVLGGIAEFPERPLKPGDKWSGTATGFNLVSGEREPVKYESKLLGREQYKGRPCVKVHTVATVKVGTKIDAPDGSASMKVAVSETDDVTWRFDYERGAIMSGEGTGKMTVTVVLTPTGMDSQTAKLTAWGTWRTALTEFNGQVLPAK